VTERTPNAARRRAASTARCHRTLCPITRRALQFRQRLRAICARDLFFPAAITALVLATAAFAQSPLRDAVTHGDVTGMRLAISREFAMVAPFCAILDMQSLLTVPQHIAVLATLLVGFVVWRVFAFLRGTTYPVWRQELGSFVIVLLVPVGLLLINVLMPRPMGRLELDDADLVAVDVHAHTASSHDARPDWTQQRVREWHQKSGFHVAYITDHKRFGGAIDAVATNPERAGDGVVLLSGLELRSRGQHVNVLSMTQAETSFVVHGDHLQAGIRLADGRTPLVVQTIPFNFAGFSGPGQDTLPVTRAIELNDGAPRGLTTGLKRHADILHLADSLNLALVAGSDNHGWGNTASGWTLVRVPGWRDMTPAALAVALETEMGRGRAATQVVERRTPLLMTVPQVALTVPVMFVSAARGLTTPERVSWIAWGWTSLLVRLGVRRAAHLSLARARLARRQRRQRIRVVPIAAQVGMQR
jgi:hypothetical protein